MKGQRESWAPGRGIVIAGLIATAAGATAAVFVVPEFRCWSRLDICKHDERCKDFTGTYGVYAVGSGKATVSCHGGSEPCKLNNGVSSASLVPDDSGINKWIAVGWTDKDGKILRVYDDKS